MHFLVIGGSGRTGKLVIEEALKRGHTVTALVREPTSLEVREGLTIVKGTPLSPPSITTALTSPSPPNAIIITLNPPRASDNPFAANIAPPRLMADSHANLVSAIQSQNLSNVKIVTMSAFGTGDSFKSLNITLRLLFRWSNMRFAYNDHDAVDKEMKEREGLQWVLVRPVMLTDSEEEGKEVKIWGNRGKGVGMFANISRRSVAGFLIDAAEKGEWDGQTPVISN